jgi:hypothetical protein
MTLRTTVTTPKSQLSMTRGKVLAVDEHGAVSVTFSDEKSAFSADLLVTSDSSALRLVPGDDVLVWTPPDGSRAVVVGRLETGAGAPGRVPDELLLEAKRGLVLRVGEGSITIRADGKILIKGKDLVSHAKRMNRIKGGSVSLN